MKPVVNSRIQEIKDIQNINKTNYKAPSLKPKTGSERRQSKRVVPELHHKIHVKVNHKRIYFQTQASDISLNGIQIKTENLDDGYKMGEEISSLIHLPWPIEQEVSIVGSVQYIARNFIGIKFVKIDEFDRTQINNYISYRLKEGEWYEKMKYQLKKS